MITFSILLMYFFLGIVSLVFGLICKLLISSIKVCSWLIGFYIGVCVFLLIFKASLIMIVPILLVLLGVFIEKNIKNKE